jgi:hypothetical protein
VTDNPPANDRKPDGGPADWHEGVRRYIAASVVGDNPPRITAEARALIRAALGPGQAGETSSTA